MDLQTLSNLFSTTLSPDPNVRKAGELQIRKIAGEPGMVSALLQIIASDSIDPATRQSCSVWLKNRVQTCYVLDPSLRRVDHSPVPNTDREALRAHILPLLAASPSRSINVQLAATLKNIISHDFPERWPNLLNDIKNLLTSNDVRQVHAGCVAVLEAVRAFRFRQDTEIRPRMVNELFPTLVDIGSRMLQTPPNASQDIPTMLHLIIKSYRTSISIDLSAHQQSAESIMPWGQLFFSIVNLQLTKEAVPEVEDEREECEWWKAKKWAYSVLDTLFHRYGNPSQLPTALKKKYLSFAQHFVTAFAPEILNTYLRQVDLYVTNQTWLSKKCQYHIFNYFTQCIKPKSTWTLLKPHVENLISSFVFPQLAFNSSKQAAWENDPVEYLRASIDEYESFSSPVSAATSFLYSLATNRTKSTFLPTLAFINNVLGSNAPPPQRFGALNMTAALGPWMLAHPDVKGKMEQFVLQFVLPEYTSSEPYMRAVACEILGTVAKAGLNWSNEENLAVQYRAVIALLDDSQLPVRVHAALALTELVVNNETVKAAVAPQVGKFIQDLLKLSDETDLEVLGHSMEVMVDCYQTELLPVATQLSARLCESYMRLARECVAQEDAASGTDFDAIGDDDKTYSAMNIAKTIGTVVSSIDNAPEILAQVQDVILPIIIFTLEKRLLELLDNMYDLVDSLTFRMRTISPNMWPVLEITYKLFKSEAVDFLDEMLPSLDNFVSFGSDVIKTRADYKQMLVDIYTTAMTNDQLGENDRVNGCKLAESLLLNLRGNLDEFLQTIVNTALSHFDKAETKALKLSNLEVLVNAVLYNPSAALHFIEGFRPGMARTFFDSWFNAIKSSETQLPRVHDKKLSILALCALLELAPVAIPENLKGGWPAIVGGAIKVFHDLPRAVEERQKLEEQLETDLESDEGVDDKLLNLKEDDEDVWDEEYTYLEMLAEESARLREAATKSSEEDDSATLSSESEEEIEEELGYISPLDVVDPYITFKSALTTFQMQNGPVYQAATTALSIDEQTALMEIMRIAETHVNAPAA
ncbi:Armadillo-type fold [Amanita muscaria]